MSSFTPRETAWELYVAARNAPKRVLGADPIETWQGRASLLERAAAAIHRAQDGPAQRFAGEPSDADLLTMAQQVQTDRQAMGKPPAPRPPHRPSGTSVSRGPAEWFEADVQTWDPLLEPLPPAA